MAENFTKLKKGLSLILLSGLLILPLSTQAQDSGDPSNNLKGSLPIPCN